MEGEEVEREAVAAMALVFFVLDQAFVLNARGTPERARGGGRRRRWGREGDGGRRRNGEGWGVGE